MKMLCSHLQTTHIANGLHAYMRTLDARSMVSQIFGPGSFVTVLAFTKQFGSGTVDEMLRGLLQETAKQRATIPAEVPEVRTKTDASFAVTG